MKKFEMWYPVKPRGINQAFGAINHKYDQFGLKGHNGIDFYTKHGAPVRAAHDGIVTYSGLDESNGSLVIIRTEEKVEYLGQPNGVFMKTLYGHLIREIPVKAGTKVKAGDIIGWADNTGFSTGDHLHFGLKPQSQATAAEWSFVNVEQNNGYKGAIDPEPYFNKYFAEDAVTVLSILGQQISTLKKIAELYDLLVRIK